MRYQVRATNKRGYTQESEIYTIYSDAFNYAMECKESGQYSVIVITKDQEGTDHPSNSGKFFLHRIIK